MYSVSVYSVSIVVYSSIFTSDAPDSWWFLQILASVLHGNMQLPQVGPCHHSVARHQVADGGAASDMEVSWEYIE